VHSYPSACMKPMLLNAATLVAISRRPGTVPASVSARAAVWSITCSQLSKTTTSDRSARSRTDVVENELLAGEMEAAGVPGVAGPLRVHLRLEFHDEGNGKTRLELRQGPFATGQLGADTRSGWESSFTKLDTLLRASLAPDLGTRRP